MKRLLKISLDRALLSLIPVLSWFALGILIDNKLINVFSLIYPIQFIVYMFKSIFSTGANINKEKDNNKNATMSGIVIGSVVSFFVFVGIVLNLESYISFMNMDVETYKAFALYAVIQLYIQLIFAFFIEKLYFEEKNNTANWYSVCFNLLNFIVLILASIIFKNNTIIIAITLISISIYTLIVAIKESNKFKLTFNLIKWIKYDSVEVFNYLSFFFIFLFGLSNVLEYGEAYVTALTFIALITDTQWDTYDSITVVAKIDISKNKFNYKYHKKNAYKLLGILMLSTVAMFLVLFKMYNLNNYITVIFFSIELINFMLFPIYRLKTCFLQLEYSAVKTTINKVFSSGLRFSFSFIKNPYCTGMGQLASSIYQFITINFIFRKKYIIDKEGKIILNMKN